MIPQFPNFKTLEITNREAVLRIIKSFSPYSDFDFGSMWSWDYTNSMSISELNNNLVVKFSDYITGEYFYSFLGSNLLNETANILLSHAKDNGLLPYLKLVPQIVAHNLNQIDFVTTADPDNFDYVLTMENLATLAGSELSSKRRAANIFIRRHGELAVAAIDLAEPEVKQEIFDLFALWAHQKIERGQDSNEHELVAIERCLENAEKLDLFAAGMYDQEKLIAFWIVGLRENNCSISHFEKADTGNYEGIFPYFKREVAKLLLRKDVHYINLEQDLGIPGLRQSKQAYQPTHTFDKYIVHTNV